MVMTVGAFFTGSGVKVSVASDFRPFHYSDSQWENILRQVPTYRWKVVPYLSPGCSHCENERHDAFGDSSCQF